MQNISKAGSKIEEARQLVNNLTREELEKYGKPAIEYIGDYPLYGAMSNISYEEAILLTIVLEGKEFFEGVK